MLVDPEGTVIADAAGGTIRKVGPNGIIATVAGRLPNQTSLSVNFNYPFGVAADTAGNVYVAETKSNRVRRTGYENWLLQSSEWYSDLVKKEPSKNCRCDVTRLNLANGRIASSIRSNSPRHTRHFRTRASTPSNSSPDRGAALFWP